MPRFLLDSTGLRPGPVRGCTLSGMEAFKLDLREEPVR